LIIINFRLYLLVSGTVNIKFPELRTLVQTIYYLIKLSMEIPLNLPFVKGDFLVLPTLK